MTDPDPPAVRIRRGHPDDAETAALVAVLTALAARPAAAPEPAPPGGWRDRGPLLRGPLRPGPAGWRTSGRPGR